MSYACRKVGWNVQCMAGALLGGICDVVELLTWNISVVRTLCYVSRIRFLQEHREERFIL